MATLQNLLDDLDSRLGARVVVQADKIRAINNGIKATWPHLWRTSRDSTLVVVVDTYEYLIPTAIANNSKLLMVEIESLGASGRYTPVMSYRVLPGVTDPLIVFEDSSMPGEIGAKIRLSVARRLSDLANVSDVYDGPGGTEELPVLYAMGILSSGRVEDRTDHTRYPTVTGANGVTVDTLLVTSQYWFSRFDQLLEQFSMPLPVETAG